MQKTGAGSPEEGCHAVTCRLPTPNPKKKGAEQNVSLDTFQNVFINHFRCSAMGCRKMKRDRGNDEGVSRSRVFTTCLCHCVPDAVPMAFPLDLLEEAQRARLKALGVYFILNDEALKFAPDWHPFKDKGSTVWTMNPVWAMCLLRCCLERKKLLNEDLRSFTCCSHCLSLIALPC